MSKVSHPAGALRACGDQALAGASGGDDDADRRSGSTQAGRARQDHLPHDAEAVAGAHPVRGCWSVARERCFMTLTAASISMPCPGVSSRCWPVPASGARAGDVCPGSEADYTSPGAATSVVTIELARSWPSSRRGSVACSSATAARKPPRHRSSSPASTTRPTARTGATRSCRCAALSRGDDGSAVGNRLESPFPGIPPRGRSGRSRRRLHQRHASLLSPVRARADPSLVRARLRHHDRTGDPRQRPGPGVLRHPRAGHGDGRGHHPAPRLPGQGP